MKCLVFSTAIHALPWSEILKMRYTYSPLCLLGMCVKETIFWRRHVGRAFIALCEHFQHFKGHFCSQQWVSMVSNMHKVCYQESFFIFRMLIFFLSHCCLVADSCLHSCSFVALMVNASFLKLGLLCSWCKLYIEKGHWATLRTYRVARALHYSMPFPHRRFPLVLLWKVLVNACGLVCMQRDYFLLHSVIFWWYMGIVACWYVNSSMRFQFTSRTEYRFVFRLYRKIYNVHYYMCLWTDELWHNFSLCPHVCKKMFCFSWVGRRLCTFWATIIVVLLFCLFFTAEPLPFHHT